MRAEEDFELDGVARGLLRAYAHDEQLPVDVSRRVWRGVGERVEAQRRRRGWIGGLVVATAAAAIALVWMYRPEPLSEQGSRSPSPGIVPYAVPERDAQPVVRRVPAASQRGRGRAVETPSQVPSLPSAPPVAVSKTPEQPPPDASAPKPRKRQVMKSKVKDATPSRPVAAPPASTLGEEASILHAAQAALAGGQPARALQLVERATARFPDGVLRIEREALRAIAICTVGDAGGPALARAFVRAHPASAAVRRVKSACGLRRDR